MHGCNGRVGQIISGLLEKDETMKIVAGVDRMDTYKNSYPVYENINDCDIEADVIIDFSNSSATDALLKYAIDKKIGVVLCTTGLSEEQLSAVDDASRKIPVLRSANMSLGVNLMIKLVKEAAATLYGAGFDEEEQRPQKKTTAGSRTDIISDIAITIFLFWIFNIFYFSDFIIIFYILGIIWFII